MGEALKRCNHYLFLSLAVFIFLWSCGAAPNLDTSTDTDTSTATGTGTGTDTGTGTNTSTDTDIGQDPTPITPPAPEVAMFVRGFREVDESEYLTHVTGDFDESCSISKTDLDNASQAIIKNCLMEVFELNAANANLKLDINIPEQMCNWTEYLPPTFWDRQPGVGPTAVTFRRLASGQVVFANNFTITNGTTDTTTNGVGATVSDEGDVTCQYTYQDRGSGNIVNCCIGEGTVTINNEDPNNLGNFPANLQTVER